MGKLMDFLTNRRNSFFPLLYKLNKECGCVDVLGFKDVCVCLCFSSCSRRRCSAGSRSFTPSSVTARGCWTRARWRTGEDALQQQQQQQQHQQHHYQQQLALANKTHLTI